MAAVDVLKVLRRVERDARVAALREGRKMRAQTVQPERGRGAKRRPRRKFWGRDS